MEKTVQRLKAEDIADLPAGKHADGDGLFLIVKRSGARSWSARVYVGDDAVDRGLGGWPTVGIREARRKLVTLRERLKAEFRAPPPNATSPTLEAWSEKCIERWAPTWKQAMREAAGGAKCKSKQRYENALLNHAAHLHTMPVDTIEPRHIIKVLEPIWTKNPEMARHTQMAIARVLDAAIQAGDRTAPNPARADFSASLGARRTSVRGPHRALDWTAAPAFLADLLVRDGMGREALTLTVLTGLRTSEVIEATWGEFDLGKKVWLVPAQRTKNAKVLRARGIPYHRVPLSAQVLALLERLRGAEKAPKASAWVFPGEIEGKPISSNTMRALLIRMKVAATVHGFRSTVRDWAGDQEVELVDGRRLQEFSWESCEITLGHVVGNEATRAYRRGDALEERRRLLQRWADFLDGVPDSREPVALAA